MKVPLYEELNVNTLWNHYRQDERLRHYMPDQVAKGRQVDRTWFYNVFHTIAPETVQQIIDHAEKQRADVNGVAAKEETIAITEEWRTMLKEIPFKSSK